MDALLKPHQEATAERCREVGAVYVISDTSEVSLSGEERGTALERIQGRRRGFLAHTALAVSAQGNRAPLGVLGLETIVRDDEPKKDSESPPEQALFGPRVIAVGLDGG